MKAEFLTAIFSDESPTDVQLIQERDISGVRLASERSPFAVIFKHASRAGRYGELTISEKVSLIRYRGKKKPLKIAIVQ
jgi:hypothetical protein